MDSEIKKLIAKNPVSTPAPDLPPAEQLTKIYFKIPEVQTGIFRPVEKLADVEGRIQEILNYCIAQSSPLGYFAALYTKVAQKIEAAILNKEFEDNDQLARMDVNFVNYYVRAMNDAFENRPAEPHWEIAIKASKQDNHVVLEHLFVAMNAHINYDLSNAVKDTVPPEKLVNFQGDYNKVNAILFSLLDDVQDDISNIFYPLKWYLKFGKKLDDKVIAVLMGEMRANSFFYACALGLANPQQEKRLNSQRMQEVTELGDKIMFPKNWIIKLLIFIIRLLEKGTVKDKIENLLK